jgi:hypothetical protein
MNDETRERRLASRGECRDAIRSAFAAAADAACRELWLCDADFIDWPLGEVEVIESLTRWAGPHQRLTLFALGFEAFAQRHPRWLEWRRRWSHLVECRTLEALEAGRVPSLLLAPGLLGLRIFDVEHGRGLATSDPIELRRCRETIDALLQRSVESLPVTTLGL